MKQNVLQFKNDIKVLVEDIKNGHETEWMHPVYRAYYILKHNIVDGELQKQNIDNDIERSYKALRNTWEKNAFRRKVDKYLEKYGEETLRID